MTDIDQFLTPEQKQRVVHERLWEEGASLDSQVRVRHDGRYAWDFSVVKKGQMVEVTFSLKMGHPRFLRAVQRCARAVDEVKRGERSEVFAGDGPFKGR